MVETGGVDGLITSANVCFTLDTVAKLRLRRNRATLIRRNTRGQNIRSPQWHSLSPPITWIPLGDRDPEMKTIFGYLSISVLFAVVVAAVLLFTTFGERPLTALFSVGDVEAVDFADLKLTDNPNQFLMCPPGYCNANPHADSPVFDVSVEQLRERWRDIVTVQPHVKLLAEDKEGQQSDYVQRSARFRFPDIITVRFISVSSSQSMLAIYSRSVYGKSDFGVNRERIDAWLKTLREGL